MTRCVPSRARSARLCAAAAKTKFIALVVVVVVASSLPSLGPEWIEERIEQGLAPFVTLRGR